MFKKLWRKAIKRRNKAIIRHIDRLRDKLPEDISSLEEEVAYENRERDKVVSSLNSIINFVTFAGSILLRNHPAGKIITAIKLLKPLFNLVTKQKEPTMKLEDLKHLDTDTAEALLLVCHLGNAMGKSAEDGKLGIDDAIHFMSVVKAAPAAFSGIKNFGLESDDERDEAVEYVKAHFDIPQDKLEGMIESGLVAAEKLYEIVELFKK